jgi:hypothetical protein
VCGDYGRRTSWKERNIGVVSGGARDWLFHFLLYFHHSTVGSCTCARKVTINLKAQWDSVSISLSGG